MHPMLIVALIGAVVLLAAWAVWAVVRHLDRRNALVAAAAPLPIDLVNVWDRVWIRGEIECDDPRAVPHFGYGCVHYHYRLEHKETRTERTSSGGTRTTTQWVTRDQKDGTARFRVRQGDDALLVHAEKAEWHFEQSETVETGNRRHHCTYTLSHGPVSVAGVVGETKETLEPLKHVPLIVTPVERKQFLEQVETDERRLARFGLILLFVGLGLLIYGLWRTAQVSHPDPQARFWQPLPEGMQVAWWNPGLAAAAALAGLAPTLLFWSLRAYNSLVVLRTRADMAWSQIDVHLKQRYDLIPMLVEVVQGYAKYEKTTLEELTALRSRALAGDRSVRVGAEVAAVEGVTRVIALAEAYPALRADVLFRKLADQVTALEDKIAHARSFFNDSVAEYNTYAARFPSNLIAAVTGFRSMPLFAAELQERAAPRLA
jgi:LemA protein